MCLETYSQLGVFASKEMPKKVLHLAPEKVLSNFFVKNKSISYFPSDPQPHRYPWMPVLRLLLPADTRIFPDGYFDYVIHNHVLEHLPGHWKDHLHEFKRLLAVAGQMIFTVPGPKMSIKTKEGGELLASDEERLREFGQEDHYRMFGADLPAYLGAVEGMGFEFDSLSTEDRARLSVPPGSSRVMIWTKG